MDLPFDTKRTNAKLSAIHDREEEDVARILSDKYNMTYADLSIKEINSEAIRIIKEDVARDAEVGAFEKVAKTLSLAVHNPNNPNLKKVIDDLTRRGFGIQQFLVSKKSLDKVLSLYSEISASTRSEAGVVSIIDDSSGGESMTRATLSQKLDTAINTKSFNRISNIFEVLLSGAFALRASDIHFEPGKDSTLVRLRIDGLLTDTYNFDTHTYNQLMSRIKLLSGLKLNISDISQDGRFSIDKPTGNIEMRVSLIPGNYGESIVMRILDPKETKVSYKELGIHPKLLSRLEKEIRRSNGMLLTTGPTGSGKTTTLYSFLREIHAPEIKIITIEDPVEYHIDGIVQTQVEEGKYTFSEGLRSIVRQDPDVIMVGEIRDGETASIAIQAALTGHFVFSTLHTNDAAGTFPRLADLGVDPKSFGSAITVSMAQRLVRKLDQNTKKERPVTNIEKQMIDKVLSSIVDKSLIPKNIDTVCEPSIEKVDGNEITGYKGRVGLYEALFMDDEMATFLRDNPPSREIAKIGEKQGYLTMTQDGIIKVLSGITSISEVAGTVDLG